MPLEMFMFATTRMALLIGGAIGGATFPLFAQETTKNDGGIAYNREEFEEICERGLDLSPTNELLIDESLIGWKEYEMEV
ncbi:hypothetical protein MJL81_30780, partial [Salmonella enterica subsp. enterica serovar Anatum]|nr:hypothetical protein [Salmonella enterica subsp. enterica serovar Anatum]